MGAERPGGSMGWDDGGGGDNPRAGEPATATQVGLGETVQEHWWMRREMARESGPTCRAEFLEGAVRSAR